jgi:type II secretory pathway pseudopilin PulG
MDRANAVRGKQGEEGYTLVAVVFLVAILTLSLSVAAPKVARDIQRDRERETVQRGKQYIRAIKLYYKKFNAYPPNVDALVKTNEIRFLRKKYVDPTTGKDEWKPIQFGQAKTQTLGFFGQPLAGTGSAGGTVLAGTGPSGGNAGSSGIGQSIIGQSQTPGSPNQPGAGGTGTGTGTGTDSGSGPTFGGVGIIGFTPGSAKQSILFWKKKNHYNEWEFVYDPLTDMTTMGSSLQQTPDGSSPTPPPAGPTPQAPVVPQN